MKFYRIDDLLKFGGNIEKLPKVKISFSNNEINSITNTNTGMGLSISKKYEIVNINKLEKKKVKF